LRTAQEDIRVKDTPLVGRLLGKNFEGVESVSGVGSSQQVVGSNPTGGCRKSKQHKQFFATGTPKEGMIVPELRRFGFDTAEFRKALEASSMTAPREHKPICAAMKKFISAKSGVTRLDMAIALTALSNCI
jgi:hypothetical protein